MSRPERRAEPSGPVEAAALDLPGGPRGVLLLHGFTGTPYELRPLGHALHAAGYTVCAPLLPMFPKLGRSGGLVDPTHRAANPAYPVLPMRSGRQLLPFLLATRKLAGRVRQPSLVAHGAHDRITLPMGARQLARSLGSEQVWQLSLPRSAHLITLDHDRERLAAAAVAFLEQVL